jgi:hypothetical protein
MERRLAWLSSAVVILNLLDAVFTIIYTNAGYASEANPLMAVALASTPVVFVLAKVSLVSLGVLLLWRVRDRAFAAFGIVATAAAYALVVLYHLTAVPDLVVAVAG